MRTRVLLALAALSCAFSVNAAENLTLADAVKKKLIQADIKAKGGFTGAVIDLSVTNISAGQVAFSIDAGLQLHPADNSMQDIILTETRQIVLKSKQKMSVVLNGMCCKAHNKPPAPGTSFSIGKPAGSSLLEVTRFIDANKMHTSHDAQHAIWVFSDNKRVEGMDVTVPTNKKLIQLVCKLSSNKEPEYTIEYEKDPNMPFSGKAVKVKGFFKCPVEGQSTLTMALFDDKGNKMSADQMPGPPKPGVYNFEFGFSVKGYTPGIYYGRVIINEKVVSEVKLEI